jgi:hypothetical protein
MLISSLLLALLVLLVLLVVLIVGSMLRTPYKARSPELRKASGLARAVVLKDTAGCTAHVSKRDQFWDQFRGACSGVKISLVSAFLWHQHFPCVHQIAELDWVTESYLGWSQN